MISRSDEENERRAFSRKLETDYKSKNRGIYIELRDFEVKLEECQKKKAQVEKDKREYLYEKRKGVDRYEIKALDFGWILNTEEGKQFFSHLAEAEDDSILDVEVIIKIVQFLSNYFKRIVHYYEFL